MNAWVEHLQPQLLLLVVDVEVSQGQLVEPQLEQHQLQAGQQHLQAGQQHLQAGQQHLQAGQQHLQAGQPERGLEPLEQQEQDHGLLAEGRWQGRQPGVLDSTG